MNLETRINDDLAISGLTAKDMRARPMEEAEKTAVGLAPITEGYVIPYYTIDGRVKPFYRVKLFGQVDFKYKQIKGTPNHVYFPPDFMKVLNETKSPYVILTEGEKKAAAAVKNGIPAIAFGGVDSWRNRILQVPKDAEFGVASYNKKLIGVKLPSSNWDTGGVVIEPVADGFEELCQLLQERSLHAVILYDTDSLDGKPIVKLEVQRAASALGFELRSRGLQVSKIRQQVLPLLGDLTKVGLDDFLNFSPAAPQQLKNMLAATCAKRTAFPRYPNMEENLNKKLQNAKLTRKDVQRLALCLITDLDARGMRMFSEEERQLYYFEEAKNSLSKVDLSSDDATTAFSKLLYKYYGVSMQADTRLMKWVGTQFPSEGEVFNVRPYRVFARPNMQEDVVRFQLNDGQYVKISGDASCPIEVLHNGSENVLFESERVEALDANELRTEFAKRQTEPLRMWWSDVLQEVRLKEHGDHAKFTALLYYLSPWLFRWRGMQLPVELVIGEPGCGKSTLCELRSEIISGQPRLRNAPSDIKDWYASIANAGGMHITDNMQMPDKLMRAKLSDEICRLITEPEPKIEMRRYYTNAEQMLVRVDAVFCYTAVTMPFTATDLIQRSVKLELDKLSRNADKETAQVSFDSMWKQKQLDRFGGRTAWVSHQLYVLHKFFEYCAKHWNPNYAAKHRLINLEQSLVLLADMFGMDSKWIPSFLTTTTDQAIVDSDWMFEGLQEFCNQVRTNLMETIANAGADIALGKECKFSAGDISVWASRHPEYMDCQNLINSRKLGRYLQNHKAMVAQSLGLHELGKYHNKMVYQVKSEDRQN